MWNISRTQECTPIVFFSPLNNTIVDLNKPKIIRNCGELTDPDYLPILEYIVNKPSMMENDGELTKIKYTLLLKHSMSNISKMQWWMPLISTSPKTYSIVSGNQPLVGRK